MKRLSVILLVFILFFASCVSSRHPKLSRTIEGVGLKSAEQLTAFFMSQRPDSDREMVFTLASYYIEECSTEGINSDVAFIQMCHETGYLKFGNLVTPEMHNYCGLGSINEENRGLVFETEQLGVRAHVQHLHAYGTTEDKVLVNECTDSRYKYVRPRGKSVDIWGLSGTWASDPDYSIKLEEKMKLLEKF